MYQTRIIIWMFLLCSAAGLSQQLPDTTYTFKEVIITSNRLENFSSGTKIQKIDSTILSRYQHGNLGDLLTQESPLFIKSYGRGSLATSAFRGGSANHTAILWNGFNINSPMNGQIDFSLIPANIANSVNIQYGGTSALWGSGALGGAIHLNSTPQFDKGITIRAGATLGSFSDYRQNLSVEISKKRFISVLKTFNTTAQNDFNYFSNRTTKELQKQTNAELSQSGIISENYFLINNKLRINLFYWFQNTDRNIPPTMVQLASTANQKDHSHRLTSEWKHTGEKTTLSARVAYFNEYLNYTESTNDLDAISKSQTLIAEVEAKVSITNQLNLNIGLNNTWEKAISDGYPNSPSRNRLAGFASLRYASKNKKSFTTLSARQEMVISKFVPFTFSLGSEYIFFDWLSAKANVAKVYRIPTFNDLYWKPGGNPQLLPESGYSGEAGLLAKYTSRNSKISLSFEPTVFNRLIDNWILWLPNQSYWSPQNIMKVWSRGMETRSQLGIKLNEIDIRLSVMTNYVVSTNEQTKTANDASIDKQLIYVPMYSGHGNLSVFYKGFSLSYTHSYTGYRYTSTDNTAYLEPYLLANIYASYNFKLRKCNLNVFAQCNNVFDTTYEVMMSRAMPLRNYQTGISVQFNQPNKN